MTCPKCKARIGVTRHLLVTESGHSAGILCYLCGYWVQEKPEPKSRNRSLHVHSTRIPAR